VSKPLDGLAKDILPSPLQLKNKILIKVCLLQSPLMQCKHFPESKIPEAKLAPDSRTPTVASVSSSSDSESDTSPSTSPKDSPSTSPKAKPRFRKPHKPHKHIKINRALSELGVYTTATHYSHKHGFDDPLSKLWNHILSFSESRFRKTIENNAAKLKEHCARYLMRVYPSALRVTSSNQEPGVCWRHGAQFVALNWQKFDVGMMQNEALFYGTGGYVLKPEYVHDASTVKKCCELSLQVVLVRWGSCRLLGRVGCLVLRRLRM